MALVLCPDCGREVSDRAQACPHCGGPVVVAEKPALPPVAAVPPPLTMAAHRRADSTPESTGVPIWLRLPILLVVSLVLVAISAGMRGEGGGFAFLVGTAMVPFLIAAVVAWKSSLTAALATVLVLVGLMHYGGSLGKQRAVSAADRAALSELENSIHARVQASEAMGAQVEGGKAPMPAPLPQTTTVPVGNTGSFLGRVQVIITDYQKNATLIDQRYTNRVLELQFEEVLSPNRLTSAAGIAQSREAMRRAALNLDEYEGSWKRLTAQLERDVKAAASGPDYAAFMGGYSRSSVARERMNGLVIANQRNLLTAANNLIDYMSQRLGRTQVAGGQVMLETEAEVAQYTRLMSEITTLAAEEQRLRQDTLDTMNQSAKKLRELRGAAGG